MYTIKTLNNIAATGLAKLPDDKFVIDNAAETPKVSFCAVSICTTWN